MEVEFDSLQFGSLQEEDLATVCALEAKAFSRAWTPEIYRKELAENPRARYWVLRDPSEILGFCGIWAIEDEAHLNTLVVSEAHRGQGLGLFLMARVMRRCIALGLRWMTLEVRDDNEAALRLYRRFGFTSVGRRQGYYTVEGPGGEAAAKDALIMWTGDLGTESYLARLTSMEESFAMKEDRSQKREREGGLGRSQEGSQ